MYRIARFFLRLLGWLFVGLLYIEEYHLHIAKFYILCLLCCSREFGGPVLYFGQVVLWPVQILMQIEGNLALYL